VNTFANSITSKKESAESQARNIFFFLILTNSCNFYFKYQYK